jgi:hypothetical protein
MRKFILYWSKLQLPVSQTISAITKAIAFQERCLVARKYLLYSLRR